MFFKFKVWCFNKFTSELNNPHYSCLPWSQRKSLYFQNSPPAVAGANDSQNRLPGWGWVKLQGGVEIQSPRAGVWSSGWSLKKKKAAIALPPEPTEPSTVFTLN